ncbi:hypothetical protein IDM40_16320 [Nocardiopsis sp. HNM0947]|uniref:Uncharacterized protein n=1 Tax=Nocardiopsis coralli TaxID=2772213 RepID=A0ABR9P8U1_9ACTN|nr:hypothetical protein [Nocardiopsis coralli]MBE3000254.1 hypothetical protein [Nocardiopsis coralli]
MFILPCPHRAVLDGVDDIDWVALGGPDALQVPDALRSVATTEDPGVDGVGDISSEYLLEIAGADDLEPTAPTPAAAHIVPFLQALVADHEVWDRTEPLEDLLFIAMSHRRAPDAQPALGRVLDGLVPFTVGLFDDTEDDVRCTAFKLAAELPLRDPADAEAVAYALRARVVSPEKRIAGGALTALSVLVPPGDTDRYLAPGFGPWARRSAAGILANSDRPWTPEATRAVLECGSAPGQTRSLVLAARDPGRREHLLRGVRSDSAGAAAWALRAVSDLSREVRSERTHLAPVLGEALDHPSPVIRGRAVRLIFGNPPAAGCLTDRLAALAETGLHESRGDGDGDWAVAALLRAGDPRWRVPVLDTLRQGMVIAGDTMCEQEVPFDPELFEAVRTALEHSSVQQVPRDHDLADLLVSWGGPAASAGPVLARLARRDLIRRSGAGLAWMNALISLGPSAHAAVPLLRQDVADAGLEKCVRRAMGVALAALTEDADALAEARSASSGDRSHYMEQTLLDRHFPLAPEAEQLRTQVRADLEDTRRPVDGVRAAVRLLELTGETELPLELARRGLAEPLWEGWPAVIIEALGDRAAELEGPLPPMPPPGPSDLQSRLERGLSSALVTGDREPLHEAMGIALTDRGVSNLDTWVRRLGPEAAPFHARLWALCEGEAPLMDGVYLDERMRGLLRAVLREQGAAPPTPIRRVL